WLRPIQLRLSCTYSQEKASHLTCGLPAFPAKSAHFQSHHSNLKAALRSDILLQFLEGRTRVFHNGATAETRHVAVFTIGLNFVIMFLTFDVHQIQLIDEPAILEQLNRSIHDR